MSLETVRSDVTLALLVVLDLIDRGQPERAKAVAALAICHLGIPVRKIEDRLRRLQIPVVPGGTQAVRDLLRKQAVDFEGSVQ